MITGFQRWRRGHAELVALALVAGAAGIALILLMVLVWVVRPRPDTVPYEAGRVCVQVLGVSVVGFVVGVATFNLQQARLERQRRVDRIRASRTEMLAAYHGVKQVRRVLRAETVTAAARTVPVDAYYRLLQELSEHQLVFETLARSALLIEKYVDGGRAITVEEAGSRWGTKARGTVTASLAGHYENIEGYLNSVVSEFEKYFQGVPRPAYVSLTGPGFVRTAAFLDDTDEFKAEVSRRIGAMLRALDSTLIASS
ncbi:hypothetical protein [Streptomyces sp. NPDC050738]|uniref:hypothetical protein n=1 Tax=Streptomyces sp. NPDC050738 TaxID=3154744 RepID=UPI003417D541